MSTEAVDNEALADGVVAAMLLVSHATESLLGDVWESAAAKAVAQSLAADTDMHADVRRALDLAAHRWPSAFSVLRHGHASFDRAEAQAQIERAVEVARSLPRPDLDDYRVAVYNIAAATAAAAAENGVLPAKDPVTQPEQEVVRAIDQLFDR